MYKIKLFEPLIWLGTDTLLFPLSSNYIKLLILLYIAIAIVILGVCGFVYNRKSIIHMLLALELILLGLNLLVIFVTLYFQNPQGYILSIFLLTLAGAESALGISLVISFYRVRGNLMIDFIQFLRY